MEIHVTFGEGEFWIPYYVGLSKIDEFMAEIEANTLHLPIVAGKPRKVHSVRIGLFRWDEINGWSLW